MTKYNFPLFHDKDEGGAGVITRDQVKLEDTWDLTALYPTPQAWSEGLAKLQAEYPALAKYKGRVGESAETLREVLELEKELDLQGERLGHYASLCSSEDSSDAGNLSREGQ